MQMSTERTFIALDVSIFDIPELIKSLRAEGAYHLSVIADQIEAQTRPPKPAEPTGLGAVVEDSKGHLWVRNPVSATDELPWWRSDLGGPYPYAELDVVRVLSDGWEPKP